MPCPICGNEKAIDRPPFFDSKVECQRCGMFYITLRAKGDWKSIFNGLSDRRKANASGWLREHQGIFIDSDDFKLLSGTNAPSVSQRADKLLLEIENRTDYIGEEIVILSNASDTHSLMGVTWSVSAKEVIYLCDSYLATEKHYIIIKKDADNSIVISPGGYAYLDELRQTRHDSSIGFCAMWFDDKVTSIWTDAIEPAIHNAGYDPKIINRVEHNNRIDDEIIAMLRRSRFVVADFTGQRGGVYFESGFALGLNLPVIWTVCDTELEDIHFDNRQYNFISWNIDNLPDFQAKLQNRIEATIGRGVAE